MSTRHVGRSRRPGRAAGALLLCALLPAAARAEDGPAPRFFDLTRGGKAVATVVLPDDPAPLWAEAAARIADTAGRWGGAPPRVVRLAREAPLPAGDLVLLGTPETSDAVARLSRRTDSPVSRVPFTDPHGFAVQARAEGGGRRLVLAARTPRGAYNAAVYCRDFLLDAGPGEAGTADVFVRRASLLRAPRLAARGTYHLSLYGVAMKYTAEDWMKVIDRYAEDGMDRVYFWLSGHHPSRKYPHLFDVDATKGTRLTVEGVRRLIRHCHDRDIKFYIGGGVFAWTASQYLLKGHPEAAAVGAGGLCPSKPFARAGTREHFLEMYDTWPEADGFLFEVRDEQGECRCPECRKALDALGSRAYGRAEITWLQEFARQAWKRNPKLRFCWLVGYAEHKSDVAYYDEIRHMSDPRFEWLDVRVGLDPDGPWRLPGPGGRPRPLAFFGRQIAHWDPFYRLPVGRVLAAARRSADEGLFGYVPAFEPGFATASYYANEIPVPVNLLPYCLTGFVYREATWDPALTPAELHERIRRRYFSPGAPRRFADDLVYLHQFSLDHAEELCRFAEPHFGYGGEKAAPLTLAGEWRRVRAIADARQRQAEEERLRKTLQKLAGVREHLKRMDGIEAAMREALPAATPKTREGFALLRRMIDDTRRLYRRAVPDPALLSSPPADPKEVPADRTRRDQVRQRRGRAHVLCHRGASEFAVENTLEAYRATFELGADGNEIDVRATKDGVLVCFHDDMLDRLLPAYGDVSDLTWEELRRLPFRDPGPYGDAARVPTLEEVFALHRRHGGLLHLDVKQPGLDRAIAALLDRLDLWGHVAYCNEPNAAALLHNPKLRLCRYKAPGLYADRREVDPAAIAAALKRPGDGLLVDDPRGVLVALGRRLGKVSREPVLRAPPRPPPPAAPPVGRLLATLRDAADWDRVAESPEERAASARRILARARAAEFLLAARETSPGALAALAERVRRRSLHKDWRYHGLDGSAALRALLLLRAPQAVELARFTLWRDDPALAAVADPRWKSPRSWADFRVQMVVFPALAKCPGPAAEKLCRDYLALSEARARQLGPPHFDEAARALLELSPRAETALELLGHRLPVVRGQATLGCLRRAREPWARAALERGAPHALAYQVPE